MKKTIITGCLFLFAAIAITWFGCQKEYNPSGLTLTDSTTTSSLSIIEKVTASLQGRVFDENGKPASGVTITTISASTITDVNGFFRVDNVQLSKNAGTVSMVKTGYFKTNKTFLTSAGTINYVEARLIPRILKGTFPATAGGTITVENSSVKFTATSVVTAATNVAYTGTVNVYAAYLDPSNLITGLTMPGNLTGLDTSNKLTLMQSFGMLAVELEGTGGEKLQIASGKTATISSAIPASLAAFAPASLPLWYFNDTLGLWKQQGSATKQGNNYVGDVSHFSFWNCDVSVNSITIKMNLKNQSGQAFSFSKVTLTNIVNNNTTSGFTDSLGTVAGVIPNGVALQLNVYDKCGGVLLTKTVGPFTTNTDLGTITITTSTSASVTINGSLLNCAGTSVTKGYAEIKLDGLIYRAAVDTFGKYSIVINRCNNTVSPATITGFDLQTNQQGLDTDTLSVQTGVYTANALKACGTSILQYISYTVNGLAYNFTSSPDSLSAVFYSNGSYTQISATSSAATSNNTSFIVYADTTSASKYAVYGLGLRYNNGTIKINTVSNGSYAATITEMGAVGAFVSGSFSGNVYDSISFKTLPMSCTFKVKRVK